MKYIITIGREYGSGGKEIGLKLAEKLGVKCYDKELLSVASKQSGISEDLFYANDEKHQGSFIYSLMMGTYAMGEGGKIYPDLPLSQKIFLAQFDAIKEIAKKGPCVIVGRCADYVLRDRQNVIKIFITADKDFKVKRLSEKLSVGEAKAENIMIKMDKKRASYYNYNTESRWGKASNYDLCINSSKVGIDKTVELITKYIEIK